LLWDENEWISHKVQIHLYVIKTKNRDHLYQVHKVAFQSFTIHSSSLISLSVLCLTFPFLPYASLINAINHPTSLFKCFLSFDHFVSKKTVVTDKGRIFGIEKLTMLRFDLSFHHSFVSFRFFTNDSSLRFLYLWCAIIMSFV